MKRILFLPVLMFFTSQISFAQAQKYDWKSMKPDQRKQIIQKMSTKERASLLHQFRENMLVSTLEVPQNSEEEFRALYAEFQEKQSKIKNNFKPASNYDNLSDEEAKRQLNESFDIGQQLLDNRKLYSEKFLKIIKPQQVLQMYQTEGKMRDKILDKKDGQGNPGSQRR